MKHLPLILLVAAAGCTQIPELDEQETPALLRAKYPALTPLQETLGPPVSPKDEAKEVEEELARRSETLDKRAKALNARDID
ncbi:hypothetical protein AVO45_05810 [Ruegeria marisrubri]|uniref:Uncharacterized protein n=1 Tax=Ruegeria marisrubri TaxID=1685379 RepID=A0A0X3U4R5_9RHOB|nr:hypothetical protein [Ruegeria marisrubri]KUJ80560.1 hypothetical protein AVO45_05810 [Ruegeria marisrubri]